MKTYFSQVNLTILILCVSKELEKAVSSRSVLRSCARFIVKYKNLEKSAGGLLLVLCSSLGMAFITFSYVFLYAFKLFSFWIGFANALIVFGAFLMLSALTTMADDAYAVNFLHQEKLRQEFFICYAETDINSIRTGGGGGIPPPPTVFCPLLKKTSYKPYLKFLDFS